jgi:hypothetical protein
MFRKFPSYPGEPHEFVFHLPSGKIGMVTALTTLETESRLTVRLAEGNLMSAPATEFRPATHDEIEKRHQSEALVRPLLVQSPLPTAPWSAHNQHTGHRPGLM